MTIHDKEHVGDTEYLAVLAAPGTASTTQASLWSIHPCGSGYGSGQQASQA
jgi:hypothetical protein